MNTKLLLPLIATAGVLSLNLLPGYAHGKPEHGGAFTEVKEYTFELVSKDLDNEKDEKAEKEHTEKMAFTLYVKDPSLKAVNTGTGSLKISDGKKDVAEAALKSSGGNFVADANLPHDGKYKVTIDFTPPGQKPLSAHVSIKVD